MTEKTDQVVEALLGMVLARLTAALAVDEPTVRPAARRRPTRQVKTKRLPGGRGSSRGRPKIDAKCSVKGCGRDYRSKGYCSAHYQYARAHGWPMPAGGDK